MREYKEIWDRAAKDAIQNARVKAQYFSKSLQLKLGDIQSVKYSHADFCGVNELPELPVSKEINRVLVTVNIIVGFTIK